MKLILVYQTCDPYEPSALLGVFTSLEKLKKAGLKSVYKYIKTIPSKEELKWGKKVYENIITGEMFEDSEGNMGGLNPYIEEIETDIMIAQPNNR